MKKLQLKLYEKEQNGMMLTGAEQAQKIEIEKMIEAKLMARVKAPGLLDFILQVAKQALPSFVPRNLK